MNVSDARAARLHRALDNTRQLLIAHVERTISELQTALTQATEQRPALGSHLAEVALAELVNKEPTALIKTGTVLAVVADYYGHTVEQLRGRRGTKDLARARQIGMYLCRELTELSLPQIGRPFKRDHTTVVHGIQKIRQEMETLQTTKDQVQDLTRMIKQRAVTDARRNSRGRVA